HRFPRLTLDRQQAGALTLASQEHQVPGQDRRTAGAESVARRGQRLLPLFSTTEVVSEQAVRSEIDIDVPPIGYGGRRGGPVGRMERRLNLGDRRGRPTPQDVAGPP